MIRYSNLDDPSHQSLSGQAGLTCGGQLSLFFSSFPNEAPSLCDCANHSRSFHIQSERDTVPFILLHKHQAPFITKNSFHNKSITKYCNDNTTWVIQTFLFASCEPYNAKNDAFAVTFIRLVLCRGSNSRWGCAARIRKCWTLVHLVFGVGVEDCFRIPQNQYSFLLTTQLKDLQYH